MSLHEHVCVFTYIFAAFQCDNYDMDGIESMWGGGGNGG